MTNTPSRRHFLKGSGALIVAFGAFGAAELADTVLNEVDWFTQSAPLSDDRTLVVMKVR